MSNDVIVLEDSLTDKALDALNGVSTSPVHPQVKKDYKKNVYEIFRAIGSCREECSDMNIPEAVAYVLGATSNRQPEVTTVPALTSPIIDILNYTRTYRPHAHDEFAPFHSTLYELTRAYDNQLPMTQARVSEWTFKSESKPQVIQVITLGVAADIWAHRCERQINFRASEVRQSKIVKEPSALEKKLLSLMP